MHKTDPLFSVLNKKCNVMVLAAGLGTRLRPATDFIPKALVELGGARAIDHIISKYQYVAGRFIIATGYSADLLENYVKGRYPSVDLFFSREEVSQLSGPGKSLVLALDYASSRLPTIVTFCDYLIGDQFSVDTDCLGLCDGRSSRSILGTYATLGEVDEGIVIDIKANPEPDRLKDGGFTGVSILHDTITLKSIAYGAASDKGLAEVDFAFDVILGYTKKIQTNACKLSEILEFGTEETLTRARHYLDGRHLRDRQVSAGYAI